MPRGQNLTDQTFGRWTVLGPAGRRAANRNRLWLAQCSCGRLAERTASDLRRSGSCGCLRGELLAERNRLGLTPGGMPRGKGQLRPPRPCDYCGLDYQPRREGGRWCSPECKARGRWAEMTPEAKAAHSRRVTEAYQHVTHVDHAACAYCGQPFHGPPLRLHCSRECLDAVIRSGKYRDRFHRRRVAAEAAFLDAELKRRLDNVP